MQRLAFGCGPIPTGRKGYFEQHSALEVSEAYADLIAGDTLHAWRKEAGREFVMILTANRFLTLDPFDENGVGPLAHPASEHGFLRPTEANRELWKAVDAQARALHANYVLIRTPASFTPSRENIKNIGVFRKDVIGTVPYKICWEARGMWDDEELQEIADANEMILARDPYVEFEFGEPPSGDVIYTLRHPRGRRNFDRDDVQDLLDFFGEHEGNVVAIFRGGERKRNAFAFGVEMRRNAGEDVGYFDSDDED